MIFLVFSAPPDDLWFLWKKLAKFQCGQSSSFLQTLAWLWLAPVLRVISIWITILNLLTVLLLLRTAHVSFPPLFIAWSRVETPGMNDLHQLLSLSKHGDALARKTLVCVWSHYDWRSLLKGQAVLRQTWKHFVRKHQPMITPVPVLEAAERLERRRVGPRNPHFDCQDEALVWNRLCELQLTHVHDPALARETAGQSEPGLPETILGLPVVVDDCSCWSCCCCRSYTFAACCQKVFCCYCPFFALPPKNTVVITCINYDHGAKKSWRWKFFAGCRHVKSSKTPMPTNSLSRTFPSVSCLLIWGHIFLQWFYLGLRLHPAALVYAMWKITRSLTTTGVESGDLNPLHTYLGSGQWRLRRVWLGMVYITQSTLRNPDIAYMLRQEEMSTDDPQIAAILRGDEEWLQELLSRSEVVSQKSLSTDPEIASMLRGEKEWLQKLLSRSEVASQKSLSTNDPEIASMLRGEEEWLQELLSRSEVVSQKSLSTDDPEIASMLRGEDGFTSYFPDPK